jgi:hypothetical protein
MLAPAWSAPACVGWKTAKRFPPQLACRFMSGAALSSAGTFCCALHGASLSLVSPRESNQRECDACVRPPEGDSGPSRLKDRKPASLCSSMHAPTGDITLPLADGRVEPARRGTSGMDAARGLGVPAIKGQGWPLYAGPRSVGGRREVRKRSSRTRMKGRAFFCLLFFARAKKSEAPYKAQPVAPAGESATPDTSVRASIGGKRFAVFHPTFLPVQAQKSETPCKAQPVAPAEESAAPDINLHATGGGKRSAVFHPTQASADQTPTAKVPQC